MWPEQWASQFRCPVGGQRRQLTLVQVVMRDRHITETDCGEACFEFATGVHPGGEAAIENADVLDTCRGQQPPGPSRPGAVPVVIDHGGNAGTHAPPAGGLLQSRPGRQRMAAST